MDFFLQIAKKSKNIARCARDFGILKGQYLKPEVAHPYPLLGRDPPLSGARHAALVLALV